MLRLLGRFFICFLFILSAGFCAVDKKSAIVIDYSCGNKIIYQSKASSKRYPASLTKIMTIYLLFDAIKKNKITFNTKFKTSKFASIQIPSKLNLKVGEKISVLDIIKALAVKSANDVAVVAAEGLCGSVENFAILMNKTAKNLGMTSTHFVNPSGVFNKEQYSSAKDMAILGISLFKNFPQYWYLFSLKNFQYNGANYPTHCKIMHWYKAADGAKTGYVCASGFNLFITAQKYNKEGEKKRLFVVVMGEQTGRVRDFYAAGLIDKYTRGYNITKPVNNNIQIQIKKAKKTLDKQIDQNDVFFEETEIPLSHIIASTPKGKEYFDQLYADDELILKIESEQILDFMEEEASEIKNAMMKKTTKNKHNNKLKTKKICSKFKSKKR